LNRTRIADYEQAINDRTRLLLRVHRSNFEITGFTEQPTLDELVALARCHKLPLMEDLGSGALFDLRSVGINGEPGVLDSLRAGIDIVSYSGDKLLGGPQCGIICGRSDLIARMRANPLLRALRTDKTTIAALAATLAIYLEPERLRELPLLAMLSLTSDALFDRATSLCTALFAHAGPVRFRPVRTTSTTGGGTMPTAEIASAGIAVTSHETAPDTFAACMCAHRPPVIGRVQDGDFVVDLRTVREDEDADLCAAFMACT